MLDLEKLNHKNFSFSNFPRKLSSEDYKKPIKKIFVDLSELKVVHSIYSWGSVKEPGISDLDLLVVLEKNAKLPLKYKSIYFMNKQLRYIIVHPFMIADKDIAKDARFIYPDTDFKKIFGHGINFKNVQKKQINGFRISLLNDIIIRHLPRDFVTVIKPQKIKARELLLRLKSLTYSLKLYNHINNKKIEGSELYGKEISELRRDWFNINQQKQKKSIVKLLKDGLKLSIKIVDDFNGYLEKNRLAEIDGKIQKIVYSGEKNKTVFIRDWKPSDSLKLDNAYIPINLAAQLVCYSAQEGVLSSYIRKNLHPKNLNYNLRFKSASKKRISILNAQAELAEKTLHLHFPAFFDFGYRQEKGMLNKMANAAYKVKKLMG